MISLGKDRTKRLVAIHGWSGVILGLLLYVVVVTGSVAVLAHEIGRWSAGGVTEQNALRAGINETVMDIAADVDPSLFEEVSIFENSAGHVVAFFHKHSLNTKGELDDFGVMVEFDGASGEIVLRREGFASDLNGTDPLSALDAFIVDLHVNLHLPHPWGLYATGVLGLLMLVAAVSGLIIHKHLVKDIFVPPRYSSALLNRRDRHILAGSWSLPFAFVLAFTGAFYSFAISLGFPTVAKSAFGGDRMAMFETLVGTTEIEAVSTAETPDIDTIIARSEALAASRALGLTVSGWEESDATITVNHQVAEGRISGFSNVYGFYSGEFVRQKPIVGNEPSAGSVAFSLMSSLHFGHFAGLLSKFIWVALGTAIAYVTLTGLHLWIERRSELSLWQRFATATTIVGYGTNIALSGAAIGFFLSFPSGTTQLWTPAGFVLAALVSIVTGCVIRCPEVRRRVLHYGLCAAVILIPVLRYTAHGGYGKDGFDVIVVMLDCMLLLAFAWLLASAYRRWHSRRGQLPGTLLTAE